MTIHEDCGVDECDLIWLICFDVLNVVEFRLINGEFDSFTELEQFDDHIIRAFSFDFIEEMHQEFGVIVVVVIVNSGGFKSGHLVFVGPPRSYDFVTAEINQNIWVCKTDDWFLVQSAVVVYRNDVVEGVSLVVVGVVMKDE